MGTVKDRSASRTLNPLPLDADAPQPASPSDAAVRARLAAVLALLAQSSAAVTPEVRTAFAAALSDEAAAAAGATRNADDVVDEWTALVGVLAPSVAAKKVAGYGPLRLHYGCELARDVAALSAQCGAAGVTLTGTVRVVRRAVAGTRALRRTVLRALRNLSGDPEATDARLRAAHDPSGKVSRKAASFEAMAREVRRVREATPAALLDDAGLTAQVIDELLAAAGQMTSVDATKSTQRNAAAALRERLAVASGRLLRELRILVASARDGRARDVSVPALRSVVLGHRAASVPARVAEPVPVAPPAPPRPPPDAPRDLAGGIPSRRTSAGRPRRGARVRGRVAGRPRDRPAISSRP